MDTPHISDAGRAKRRDGAQQGLFQYPAGYPGAGGTILCTTLSLYRALFVFVSSAIFAISAVSRYDFRSSVACGRTPRTIKRHRP